MNDHSIGDGDKRVTCPTEYLADQESDTTVVIWDPAHHDIPVRVSVISLTPKDPNEYESQRWSVIEEARSKGIQPKTIGNKAIYSYRELSKEPGFVLHYFKVGMGNEFFLFSITVPAELETSQAFAAVKSVLEGMIESLVIRKKDQQFDCCLQESEKEGIRNSYVELIGDRQGEDGWTALQTHYDAALIGEPPADSGKMGYVFGELLRQEVPSFHWKVKIDEYGRSRSLDFADAQISIFPESMIWKRLDRKEAVNLRELSSDTIGTVENLYRKYQEEDNKGQAGG